MMDFLINISRDFRVADFFDIAIMVVFFYIIMLWFKRTVYRFVFIGISILGLVYLLARFFQLYVTVFVLQGFFAILLIAIVVIFQEDLRRIFERMVMWRLLRKRRSAVSTHEEIDILGRAVNKLALRRFGALIVLKGNDHLDRHLKGGFLLEGRLSEPLLESIFDPHSVGHDGAVVIENNRITKFGCHLPLSFNTLKIGNLGLRHTAALGLAERSDALCIVVSEERGTISIAREELLEKLENPEQLMKALELFYQESFPGKKTKTRLSWLRENSREKAIAILLACGLWMTIGYQTGSVRRDFVVPIEYRNLASDLIIEEPNPKEVTVTLTGSEQAFNLLNPQLLKISLDMSKVHEGNQKLVLERNNLRYLPNLSVMRIEPGRIQIAAHRLVLINVPVRAQTFGKLPHGLALRQIMVTPRSVRVMALPQSKKDVEILTEPIDLNNINGSLTLTPRLVSPLNIQFMDNKQPQVRITIKVEQKQSKKLDDL
ncbi:MAG: diadenylate cyclase [Desulfobacteria bacterium]